MKPRFSAIKNLAGGVCMVGPASSTGERNSNSLFNLSVLFIGFVATGIATVLLGPLLPIVSARLQLSDALAGSLFSCQFVGSVAGSLWSGWLIRRLGFGKSLCFGYLLMSLFTLGLLRAPFPWLATITVLNGVGLGLVIPATNMAVSDSSSKRRTAALNLINLAWSAGAIACPSILALVVPAGLTGWTLIIFAAIFMAIGAIVSQTPAWNPHAGVRHSAVIIPHLPFVVFASLFFLYIGSEAAVAGWLATFAKRTIAHTHAFWLTLPSIFWGGILIGRAVSPIVLRHFPERLLLILGLIISAFGIATVLSQPTPFTLMAGAAISGLGMSSTYPILIALVSEYFPHSALTVSPYFFAMAGIGGAVFPWVVGVISSFTGQLKFGLLLALAGVMVQLLLSGSLITRWRALAQPPT